MYVDLLIEYYYSGRTYKSIQQRLRNVHNVPRR